MYLTEVGFCGRGYKSCNRQTLLWDKLGGCLPPRTGGAARAENDLTRSWLGPGERSPGVFWLGPEIVLNSVGRKWFRLICIGVKMARMVSIVCLGEGKQLCLLRERQDFPDTTELSVHQVFTCFHHLSVADSIEKKKIDFCRDRGQLLPTSRVWRECSLRSGGWGDLLSTLYTRTWVSNTRIHS